jgi:hypothetical protein
VLLPAINRGSVFCFDKSHLATFCFGGSYYVQMTCCFAQLLAFGCSVVTLREREPVAAALAFLTHLLSVVDKLTGEQATTHKAT